MIWVIDTCVLLDVLDKHTQFAAVSSRALQAKLDDVLTIAPLTYVEMAPAFNGDTKAQDAFLDSLWIARDFSSDSADVLIAHKAWNDHIRRKRAGEVKKRPIADVLIGAWALKKGGLITRNEADFRSLYPTLPIFNPISIR